MNNLKKLALSSVVIAVLSLRAFAGETGTPPCASVPPGEMNSPPCDSSQHLSLDNSNVLGHTVSSDSISLTEYAATEVTIGLLQSVLSLF